MPARHEPLAAVLLQVLRGMSALHLRTTLILTVDGLVATVALMLLEIRSKRKKRLNNEGNSHTYGKYKVNGWIGH